MLPEVLNTGWWHRDTRGLVARAVFTEIALAAGGIWDPRILETKVREVNQDTRGPRDLSNYRNMWNGKHAPDRATLMEAVRAYSSAQVMLWAEHPLFYLLDRPKRNITAAREAAIFYALNGVSGPLRTLLWKTDLSYEPWTGLRLQTLDHSQIAKVLDDASFDALPALARVTISTALAKHALAREDIKSFERACRSVHVDFVEAATTTPQLYIQWQQIQALFVEQLWAMHNRSAAIELQLSLDHSDHIATMSKFLGIVSRNGARE